MDAASPLPPQQDNAVINRPYPLFLERIILLAVLIGIGGGVYLAAEQLMVPAWATVLLSLPIAYVVWATVGERLAGVVQLRHRDP
ncbi:MAG: hypothetical protein L7U48_04360 [Candidatus Poseidoniaceae archaeon]|nr:hypothetical protein [Candidatus Poseidoniaceae archaeon]